MEDVVITSDVKQEIFLCELEGIDKKGRETSRKCL